MQTTQEYLEELKAKVDPYYQYSDDIRHHKEQDKLGREIQTIEMVLEDMRNNPTIGVPNAS